MNNLRILLNVTFIKNWYKKEDVKVEGRCHIAGKYRKFARNKYSINLSLMKDAMLFFIYWRNMIHIRNLEDIVSKQMLYQK